MGPIGKSVQPDDSSSISPPRGQARPECFVHGICFCDRDYWLPDLLGQSALLAAFLDCVHEVEHAADHQQRSKDRCGRP